MFDYLNPRNGPVVDGLEDRETVYAADQPEYAPLRTLKSPSPQGEVMSRWTFTPEQREAIANGADLFLELFEFHQPLRPIRIAVGDGKMGAEFFLTYRIRPDAILSDFGASINRAAAEEADREFLKKLRIAPE
jgi:hypothetical protein